MTTSAPLSIVTPDSVPILHVVFRVDRADYALPASRVLQLESYSGATPVPDVAAYVAGIIQLRGRVVPVIDLRRRFGHPVQAPTLDTRVVVAELDSDRAVALVADCAREVVSISASQERPPPQLVESAVRGVVRAIVQLGERTILLLDLDRLIQQESSSGE